MGSGHGCDVGRGGFFLSMIVEEDVGLYKCYCANFRAWLLSNVEELHRRGDDLKLY